MLRGSFGLSAVRAAERAPGSAAFASNGRRVADSEQDCLATAGVLTRYQASRRSIRGRSDFRPPVRRILAGLNSCALPTTATNAVAMSGPTPSTWARRWQHASWPKARATRRSYSQWVGPKTRSRSAISTSISRNASLSSFSPSSRISGSMRRKGAMPLLTRSHTLRGGRGFRWPAPCATL
jgi:hypothetical protein